MTENACKLASDKENIYKFSSAKMLQMFEILRQFKPDENGPQNQNELEEKTYSYKDASKGRGNYYPTTNEPNALVRYVPKRKVPSTKEWILTKAGVALKDADAIDCCECPYSSAERRCARYNCGPLRYQKQHRNFVNDDGSALCGVIFVEDGFTANVLYQVFSVKIF